MPRVPKLSPVTGEPVSAQFVHTTSGQFVDNYGRTLVFRGVNLSGSSKSPVGQQSQSLEGFWEDAEEGGSSFIGRPLNLEDGSADVHLARLRGWGYNMLRFPVTWEALEHAGPKQYDFDFMDYVVDVLRKCKEYGFRVYMDPHQDVWSRFTGGSGAPLWTIYACGMNPRNFTPSHSHMLHCEYPSAADPHPEKLPAMIWSTNYGRLANQTLYTLFFGGRDFAPKCIIDGVNIQDYLQQHYIDAFGLLADRIRDAGDLNDDCVIGWDSLNEPSEGFIAYPDLSTSSQEQSPMLKKGTFATPIQSFLLGMGQRQTVEVWDFGGFGPQKKGTTTIDPAGVRIWLEADSKFEHRWGWTRSSSWALGGCLWALHGVWDSDTGVLLQPNYFRSPPWDPSRPVLFTADYWRPHWRAWATRVRQSHAEAIHFVQPPVFVRPPSLDESDMRGRACYSTHYYDGLTLVSRHWNWYNADALGVLRGKYSNPALAVKIGEAAIRKSLQEQLGELKRDVDILGPYPTMIGEIGIPYDMDGKWSYGYTDNGRGLGNYKSQQKALDASLNGADGPNALNYTLWTYCPDGSHQWGDGWNLEDLSLWCPDDLRRARKPGFVYGVKGSRSFGSMASIFEKKGRGAATYVADAAYSAAQQRGKKNPKPIPGNMGPYLAAQANGGVGGSTTGSTPLLETGNVFDVAAAGALREPVDSDLPPTAPFDLTSLASWDNAWDFLTDGARAVGAFVRPWPTATVGRPVDWSFDIAKAQFKLVVRVTSEDAPPDGEELPTVVYVPLVHFASADALRGMWAEDELASDDSSTVASASKSTLGLADPSLADLRYSDRSSATLLADMASTSAVQSSPALPGSGDCLALDVRVSDGRWEVEGQTLRWWYHVPEAGEPPATYTLTVTRAGGPIRLNELGRPLRKLATKKAGMWNVFCADLRNCFS